jgi:ABC-type uncharacterized transport system permease subunit
VLSGISVTCFGASYLVALLLEISRLFFRGKVRNLVLMATAAAGLFAHSTYLLYQLRDQAMHGEPLVTWRSGCLIVAWILIAAYLAIFWLQRRSTAGLMLLPTSLVLIIAAHLFPSTPRAVQMWNQFHGLALLAGMALVVVGFTAALMYLLQSYRLKNKLPPRPTVFLPSLERLQRINERCLLASVSFLGIGLVSGILLNLVRGEGGSGSIPWTDPVVLASLVWLIWLLAVVLFHAFYRPARQGRKVAYLTIGSFAFLGLVLAIIWWTPTPHSAMLPQAAPLPREREHLSILAPAQDPVAYRLVVSSRIGGATR